LRGEDVACAFYGDLYFAPGARSWDLPPWDEHDVDTSLEAELLAAWWQAAAAAEPGEVKTDVADSRGPIGFALSRALLSHRVRVALDALHSSRYFSRVSDRLMVFTLKQVSRYLTEPGLRADIQKRFAAEIGADTRVVVGHSLGSVIAYEVLCAHPEWQVTDLVTLGSPLGMRSVIFDRLEPSPDNGVGVWPGAVRRWTNIADRDDIVAVPATLAGRFGAGVVDEAITNGARMHDLSRYLTARRTGIAIAAGLENGGTDLS
jgi:hypothetical protein